MAHSLLSSLAAEIKTLPNARIVGRVAAIAGDLIEIEGLSDVARLGDRVAIRPPRGTGAVITGEVLRLDAARVTVLPEQRHEGLAIGARVTLTGPVVLAPSDDWVGRVIDPFGVPLDGRPLCRGPVARPPQADPPPPAARRALGARLNTGLAVFNTCLPVVRGQRVGLFAGSGVGKSSLLAHLARRMEADVVVVALIGERGRELRDFIANGLGPEGLARSVVIAATSDRSALVRRRCAWSAMCVAEHFRDQGAHVLLLADSVTRFADAHREIASAAGELPALRGFPASTAHMIMSLCERAGPGADAPGAAAGGQAMGDITALFSVLVAGSDMDEPVADILRGVLDGHVVLDRQIAERGRFPAVDLLRSVSRSLPAAADAAQNQLISRARALLGAYERSEAMIRAGLYAEGSDAELDQAIHAWPALDKFLAEPEPARIEDSFDRLALILRRAETGGRGGNSAG